MASPAWAHCVKVDVRGLRPGAWYHYRFLVGDEASPTARTRTAPAPTSTDGLRFLVASCQNWKDGFWSAWAHAPAEDADLVIHLGDYIYEGGQGGTAIVRDHNSPEVTTLDAYRNRWGLYKGDPAIQAAHAACPWVVTWDDHEVENNYAGLVPQVEAESPSFPARRAAAYQAWWEHQAVRIPRPTGARPAHPPVARLGLTGPLPRAGHPPVPVEPGLRHRGPRRGLPRPHRPHDHDARRAAGGLAGPGPGGVDRHVGRARQPGRDDRHAAGRDVLQLRPVGRLPGRPRAAVRPAPGRASNAVVLTGDIHAAGVADLIGDDLSGTPVGTELVGTSISSRFDPELADAAEDLIAALDHVDYVNVRQRGYLRCDVTPSTLTAAFRMVDTVASPTSPIATASAWTIVAGTPGANPA